MGRHAPALARAPLGSAWDDWCGEQRRKGNHPAEDQTRYFQTAIRCAAKLVIHSLNRVWPYSAESNLHSENYLLG